MAGRLDLMIVTTCLLTFAFLMACISTGTVGWMSMQQTGKDASIIYLKADQGLFQRCIEIKHRSRLTSYNCLGLSDAYSDRKILSWEKAVAGLMVTSTIIMGLTALFSGYLMLSELPRAGLLSDMVPVIAGTVAAILATISLAIFNSKFESTRSRLLGTSASMKVYVEGEASYGYSFYIGWLSVFVQFFTIFFFFVYPTFISKRAEENKRQQQPLKMGQSRA